MPAPLLPTPSTPQSLQQRFGQFFGPQTLLSNLTMGNGATITWTDGTNTTTIGPKGITLPTAASVAVSGAAWTNVGAGGGAPAFLNGWTNIGGAYAVVSYRKDALGWVHLKGLTVAVTNGATNIFILPAGFRPALREVFSVVQTDAGQTTQQFGRLDVLATGDVLSVTTATGAWCSLASITFLAEG